MARVYTYTKSLITVIILLHVASMSSCHYILYHPYFLIPLSGRVALLRRWRSKYSSNATYRMLAECLYNAGKPGSVEVICKVVGSIPQPAAMQTSLAYSNTQTNPIPQQQPVQPSTWMARGKTHSYEHYTVNVLSYSSFSIQCSRVCPTTDITIPSTHQPISSWCYLSVSISSTTVRRVPSTTKPIQTPARLLLPISI